MGRAPTRCFEGDERQLCTIKQRRVAICKRGQSPRLRRGRAHPCAARLNSLRNSFSASDAALAWRYLQSGRVLPGQGGRALLARQGRIATYRRGNQGSDPLLRLHHYRTSVTKSAVFPAARQVCINPALAHDFARGCGRRLWWPDPPCAFSARFHLSFGASGARRP